MKANRRIRTFLPAVMVAAIISGAGLFLNLNAKADAPIQAANAGAISRGAEAPAGKQEEEILPVLMGLMVGGTLCNVRFRRLALRQAVPARA